jgi:hypothetical protein
MSPSEPLLKIAVSLEFDPIARSWTARTQDVPPLTVRAPSHRKAHSRILRRLSQRGGHAVSVDAQLVLPANVRERLDEHHQQRSDLRALKLSARETCRALIDDFLAMRMRRVDMSELLGITPAQLSALLNEEPSREAPFLLERSAVA